MAKGLDCGTSFYIAATEDTIKKQRNAFLTVDGAVMLKIVKLVCIVFHQNQLMWIGKLVITKMC